MNIMKKKRLVFIMAAVITCGCTSLFSGCGRTNFSDDIVVVESDEPIDIVGKKYYSKREKYYYTFYEDGTMYLESLNEKHQFDGTYQVEGEKITLSSRDTEGKDSIITYTMKHGEAENSVVMLTEDGQKFLLTLEEEI